MKLVETLDDQKTVRLGIVKLGTAVGKMKYALIDEVDIPIIHEYKFDARLEIDRNGEGLKVIAMGHPKSKGINAQVPLQKILWENRNGPVEMGYEVRHINGISMDNRLDNLTLVPQWISKTEQNKILQSRCTESHIWERHREPINDFSDNIMLSEEEFEEASHNVSQTASENKSERRKGVNSLYWKAITQLLTKESDEQKNASTPCSRAYFTTEGELISRECPSFYFFECHYPACTAIESEPREFAMCGRCQQARYCGRECQRDDWTVHRDHCTEAQRRSSSTSSRSLKSGRRDTARVADR